MNWNPEDSLIFACSLFYFQVCSAFLRWKTDQWSSLAGDQSVRNKLYHRDAIFTMPLRQAFRFSYAELFIDTDGKLNIFAFTECIGISKEEQQLLLFYRPESVGYAQYKAKIVQLVCAIIPGVCSTHNPIHVIDMVALLGTQQTKNCNISVISLRCTVFCNRILAIDFSVKLFCCWLVHISFSVRSQFTSPLLWRLRSQLLKARHFQSKSLFPSSCYKTGCVSSIALLGYEEFRKQEQLRTRSSLTRRHSVSWENLPLAFSTNSVASVIRVEPEASLIMIHRLAWMYGEQLPNLSWLHYSSPASWHVNRQREVGGEPRRDWENEASTAYWLNRVQWISHSVLLSKHIAMLRFIAFI